MGGRRAAGTAALFFATIVVGACGDDEGLTAPAAIERPLLYQSGGRIIAVDTTGTDDVVLIDEQSEHLITRALWSPRGTHLLTAERDREPGSRLQIAVRAADGSGRVVVSDPAGESDSWPTWSPDGVRVAYTDDELIVVDRDGANRMRVNADSALAANPHWSPAGGWIVYVGRVGSDHGIVRVRPDGSGREMLRANGFDRDREPRFSPDGRRIAFEEANDIWVMNADGSGARQITFTPTEGDWGARWSPDGRYLAHVTDAGSSFGIAVVEVASGERTDLFNHGSLDIARPPAWSGDSRRVALDFETGIAIGTLGDSEGWVGAGPGAWPNWHPGR